MRGATCTRKRLWRWRSNPLRRRDDIVEAWVVLSVWTLVVVGGAVVGLVTAHATNEAFARQRAERVSVRAELLGDVPEGSVSVGTASDRRRGTVRWTAPDGSARTGRTLVEAGLRAGAKVVVWQDGRGRLVTEPPGPTKAAVEAGVMATTAVCALAGLALGAGAVARRRLDRRRLDQWDREWDLVEPGWGHRTG